MKAEIEEYRDEKCVTCKIVNPDCEMCYEIGDRAPC